MLILLFMKLADSVNPREWNSIRRIKWLIRLKGKISSCVKNQIWETELFRKIAQQIVKKLRNYEGFVVRKLIELDRDNLMNSLCRKNPSTVRQLVNLIHELHDKVNALNDAKEFFWSWNCEQLWIILRSQSSLREFRVLEEWLAAILTCRMRHGIRLVLQQTFLKVYLLKVNHPQHSRIQRIWHRLLADWCQLGQVKFWNREKEWDKNLRVYNTNSTLC